MQKRSKKDCLCAHFSGGSERSVPCNFDEQSEQNCKDTTAAMRAKAIFFAPFLHQIFYAFKLSLFCGTQRGSFLTTNINK
jgi:hypothetical protein